MSDGITALGEVGRGPSLKELDPLLREVPGLELRGLGLDRLPEAWRAGGLYGGVLEDVHPPALWAGRGLSTAVCEGMLSTTGP